jgi:hypothetical protein
MKLLTSISLPFFALKNRIPPRWSMLPPSGLSETRPPVTGNENHTAGPLFRSRSDWLPGAVAIGTMPFFSNAAAIPGAVVTEVAPARSRTVAAAWVAPAECVVAADAAVTAEPVNRPAIAVAAANCRNARMTSPIRPRRCAARLPTYGRSGRLDAAHARFICGGRPGCCVRPPPSGRRAQDHSAQRASATQAPSRTIHGSEPRTTLSRECSVLPLNGCNDTSIREYSARLTPGGIANSPVCPLLRSPSEIILTPSLASSQTS